MGNGPIEIRTQRLLLRKVRPDDLHAAIEILGDPETNLHNPDGSASPERVAAHLEEWQAHWAADGLGYWAVELIETGEVIGFGGLRAHERDGEEVLNLFYRFRPSSWGRGFAPEMARAAVDWADRERPERAVLIVTEFANKPSQRVAVKLGFVHTGQSRTPEGPVMVFRRQEPTMAT
jgi:RimJ/RimL family protein N-acetyltransferase